MSNADEGKDVLKWYTHCAICHFKVRCRDEKVERGSKKCINLLRHRKHGH